MEHTLNEFIYCHRCKIQLNPNEDEGGFHIIAGHGQHDEYGACAECPVPEQCGPLSYYVYKARYDTLLEILKVIKLRTNSIQMDDITSQVFSINNIAEEAISRATEAQDRKK